MWESKAVMLTLLKRSFLCFVERNVKYSNTTSSESWNTHPTGQSQAHPCSLWSHKSFASSNNSQVKHSSLLPPEKVTTSVLWRGFTHHEEDSEVNATLAHDVLRQKMSLSLVLERKDTQDPLEEDSKLCLPEDRWNLLGSWTRA